MSTTEHREHTVKTSAYAVPAAAAWRISLVTGVVLGGLWAWQAGESVWEHAIRFGILLFVAPLALRAVERRVGGVRIDTIRLLTAKAALLGGALAASVLLGRVTGSADYVVAAGIALAVALVGPLVVRVAVTTA